MAGLSIPGDIALAAVEHPNGPEVWAALLAEFAAELRQVDQSAAGETMFHREPLAELDDTGASWVPRLGGRARSALSSSTSPAPASGTVARYAGRSEARMAVLDAAAARGWRLETGVGDPPEPGEVGSSE